MKRIIPKHESYSMDMPRSTLLIDDRITPSVAGGRWVEETHLYHLPLRIDVRYAIPKIESKVHSSCNQFHGSSYTLATS